MAEKEGHIQDILTFSLIWGVCPQSQIPNPKTLLQAGRVGQGGGGASEERALTINTYERVLTINIYGGALKIALGEQGAGRKMRIWVGQVTSNVDKAAESRLPKSQIQITKIQLWVDPLTKEH